MASQNWNDLIQNAEAGPQPVPEGPYNVVVDTAESKPAKSGAPMIVCVFKIIDGPYEGKKVWNNFVLTQDNPNALGYFFEHMAALGFDQSYFAQLPPPDQGGMDHLASQLVGRYASIQVTVRQWQGRNRNDVSDVKPYAGGAPQQPAAPAAPQAPAAPAAPTQQPSPQPAPPAGPAPAQPQQPAPAPAPASQPQPQAPPQPEQQPAPQQPQAPQLPDDAPF